MHYSDIHNTPATMDDAGAGENPVPPAGGTPRQPVLPSAGVRVRLMIALPVLIVLLLTLMGGMLYQMVDWLFAGVRAPGIEPLLEDFASDWLRLLVGFDLAGALVGIYLAHSITKPVQEIIRISRQVAEGDLSGKTSIRRPDEFGALGHSFDLMLESLNDFISLRNRYILDSFSGGLVTTNERGAITAINSAAEGILGLSAEQVAGKPVSEVFTGGGREQLQALIEETLASQTHTVNRRIRIEQAGERRDLSVNTSIIRGKSGELFGVIVNFRDLVELRRFYEQMNRADRLATLGTFATGLAHEIRNPLGAIKGTAQLLAEDVRGNPKSLECINVIIKEVNRLDTLVREVHDFSQPSEPSKTRTDINVLVRHTLTLARNNPKVTLREGTTVNVELGEIPPTILSQDKITQALLNIIINAFQSTPDGGAITVRTVHEADDPLPVRIEIANTGSTIKAEHMLRIFEPFFTTKDYGTGLGLSIAYQIVTHHGGDILVRSGENAVSFTVRLPLNTNDDEISV
jgi:two-component system, NtrC family, sensor histidine kinase AtoS